MALTTHAYDLRDGIVATIRAAFPKESVQTVGKYDGPVDKAMIERYSVGSPAILVTVLGGDTEARGGTVYDTLKFGLYIIASGKAHLQRSKAALLIREHLAKLLPYAEISDGPAYKAPRKIEWQNMFDGKLDEIGLTLWAGAWEQMLELPALENYDDLDDFARLWAEVFNPGEVADEPETGNALTEQQIDLETV